MVERDERCGEPQLTESERRTALYPLTVHSSGARGFSAMLSAVWYLVL